MTDNLSQEFFLHVALVSFFVLDVGFFPVKKKLTATQITTQICFLLLLNLLQWYFDKSTSTSTGYVQFVNVSLTRKWLKLIVGTPFTDSVSRGTQHQAVKTVIYRALCVVSTYHCPFLWFPLRCLKTM